MDGGRARVRLGAQIAPALAHPRTVTHKKTLPSDTNTHRNIRRRACTAGEGPHKSDTVKLIRRAASEKQLAEKENWNI